MGCRRLCATESGQGSILNLRATETSRGRGTACVSVYHIQAILAMIKIPKGSKYGDLGRALQYKKRAVAVFRPPQRP